MEKKLKKTDDEWRSVLTEEQYHVTREKGTERPFTGKYHDHKEKGMYVCVSCGEKLFGSDTKFDSGSGWPSFYKPHGDDKVAEQVDQSHGMVRTEVLCSKCDAHLGHVFPDGPKETGLRYCINSCALEFQGDEEEEG